MKFLCEQLSKAASAWLLAIVVAFASIVLAVWWGGVNQDEGWYLYAARLVGEGQVPYRDFFFTQGPVLPYVYSVFPIRGLLSGRLVTLGFSVFSILVAVAYARSLVAPNRRNAVSLAVFAMLACNLYHMYFTSMPKTYALGSLFVMLGFLFLRKGFVFLSAMSFAFASGTRISLVLILGVVGVGLLLTQFRQLHWLRFGLGGVFGLFLVYGFFSIDDMSRNGLLAAQAYHAGRGGFDAFFAAGSVSRLARGYLPLGALMFAAFAMGRANRPSNLAHDAGDGSLRHRWFAGLSFAAVFLLQLSAPFPYDDYQVPIMSIPVVLVSVMFANRVDFGGAMLKYWFPVLLSAMYAFSSSMIQEWLTDGHDRFWALTKDRSELSQIREVAKKLEAADPGGEMLLTQDLYLAVEMGRKVPKGLEMGPFSYFGDIATPCADAINVMNRQKMERLLESAPCRLAAFSGYGFAITVPKGVETPKEVQNRFYGILEGKYRQISAVERFGQHNTTLRCFLRKDGK